MLEVLVISEVLTVQMKKKIYVCQKFCERFEITKQHWLYLYLLIISIEQSFDTNKMIKNAQRLYILWDYCH